MGPPAETTMETSANPLPFKSTDRAPDPWDRGSVINAKTRKANRNQRGPRGCWAHGIHYLRRNSYQ